MFKFYSKFFVMLVLTTGITYFTQGQTNVPLDSLKRLDIIKADRYNFQKRDSAGNFLSLAGNVQLRQEKTLFYCDSAVLNQKDNIFEAYGNIHINDADSVHTYSQYLKYYAKDKKAILRKNVRLTDKQAVLTTNELDYNTFTKIGIYTNGGKVVNGKTVLTSTEGHYYGETRDIYFKKKVVLTDPEYKITTDTLLYNTYTQIARFIVPTKIVSDKRTIRTSEGFYDVPARKAVFGKRPIIEDPQYTLIADDVAFDDATGFGEAQGNAIYKTKDTANSYTIVANNLKSNSKTGAVLATQKPLMIIKQGRDSIFVAADTLFSGKLSETRKYREVPVIIDSVHLVRNQNQKKKDSSSNRFLEAYFNVRIFSDSMQAVGDSLFYSFEDSAFRLFKNPVVWAQGNQVMGDTIYVYTLNKKPKRFYVFENALAISKAANSLYNQVKGTTINGYFVDGNIDYLRAKGNAESVYYAADDKGAFIGANRATSDVIDMYFKERKPNKIVSRNNLKGTLTPIRQVAPEQMKLRGFKWLEEKRPKSKFELLGS
jgi:lipopolysaccharide export system protein LptA